METVESSVWLFSGGSSRGEAGWAERTPSLPPPVTIPGHPRLHSESGHKEQRGLASDRVLQIQDASKQGWLHRGATWQSQRAPYLA